MKNFYLIIIFLTSLSYSQIANRWQPDSVYENRKVKKILVFLNSPEDISEIVEFDKNGKRTRKKIIVLPMIANLAKTKEFIQ